MLELVVGLETADSQGKAVWGSSHNPISCSESAQPLALGTSDSCQGPSNPF